MKIDLILKLRVCLPIIISLVRPNWKFKLRQLRHLALACLMTLTLSHAAKAESTLTVKIDGLKSDKRCGANCLI